MKAISIYTITRNQNTEYLQKLERQLSGRDVFLKIREWELDSMKALVSELERHMQAVYALRFFYSFQIPRLGKEFDLLQIKEEQILNLELKSGQVSDEAIRKQLIQNRYYLAALGKPIRSYTYISSQNRLVRLTNHDRIVEADWEQLCRDLQQESADYPGNIEDLFQAELYLISPLTEPGRFLKKEYFLTYQQRDIERQILKKIRAMGKPVVVNGGDIYVTAYQSRFGSAADIMTGVNQESVWSRIDFTTKTFHTQKKTEREYFCQYLQACKADGMDVYLLEYTTDHKLIRRIKKYCRKKKYDYYIADSLELGI